MDYWIKVKYLLEYFWIFQKPSIHLNRQKLRYQDKPTNYLSDRTQYVDFENCKSDILNVTTGIPQGSILGPFLFIIYINEIINSSIFFLNYFACR